MKKFWQKYRNVLFLLVIWRTGLFVIERVSPYVVPLHYGYNGPIPWANHDGIYYLKIADIGYFQYSEAFFPLYPFLISILGRCISIPLEYIASFLSFFSFLCGILILYTILLKENTKTAFITFLFLLTFPTSFFYLAVYPTSLFFLFMVLIYVNVQKRHWLWCGIVGALASATHIVGIFLFLYVLWEYIASKPKKNILRDTLCICLMPLGLVAYMIYLYFRVGDPLLFFHLQPLFGANRQTTLILLPQVFWRYGRIIFTAFLQPTPASYVITILELCSTIFAYSVIWYGLKIREKWSLLFYSFCVITLPTLTGTFSSMPRYVLNALPLFFILGKLDNKRVQYILLFIFMVLQILLSAMFLRGWFVA